MNTEKLLTNIATAFDSSNHKESEDLLKRIIELATKKLFSSNNLKNTQTSKIQQSSKQINKILKESNHKGKRKFISKAKLKRTALKKIANQNKRIHEHFLKINQKQQLKIETRKTRTNSYSLFQLDRQEEKLQSQEYQPSNLPAQQQIQNRVLNISEPKINTLNKKLKSCKQIVNQKFKKTRKNFQNYLKSKTKQSKADDITCPICIEVLMDPVSTLCGHSFCFRCLDESLLFGSNCPVCRLLIKGLEIVPCTYLKELIKIKCDQYLDDETALATYHMRKQQNLEWKKERFIDPSKIKQGDVLDVRDTQNIWCKATVMKIYCVNGKVSSILVHYLQWAKIYDQIIEIKSIRLAPMDHFSARVDLPRYNLGSQEENLRGAVITGNNNQNSLRNNNNQLVFSNILQLDSLRNRISSLQNNVRARMAPLNFFSRNHEVDYLHQFIEHESDNSEQQPPAGYGSQAALNQGAQNYDDSSLGSFAFGQQSIPSYHEPSDDNQEEAEQNFELNEQHSYIMIQEDSVGQNYQSHPDEEQEFQENEHEQQNYPNRSEQFSGQSIDYVIEEPQQIIPSSQEIYHQIRANFYDHDQNEDYSFEQNSVSQ